MIDQPTQLLSDLDRQDPIDVAMAGAAVVGALPRELVFTERAAAQLRDYLVARGLAHYRIFFGTDVAYDIDEQLDALGESGAAWERLESLVAGGETVYSVELSEQADSDAEPRRGSDDAGTTATLRASGVLRLRRAEIVFARWHVQGLCLSLCAAPTTEHYQRLRARILRRRRAQGSAVWQVVRGYVGSDDPRTPRDPAAAEDVLLPPTLHRRI